MLDVYPRITASSGTRHLVLISDSVAQIVDTAIGCTYIPISPAVALRLASWEKRDLSLSLDSLAGCVEIKSWLGLLGIKHQAGRHDQSTHGRGGSSPIVADFKADTNLAGTDFLLRGSRGEEDAVRSEAKAKIVSELGKRLAEDRRVRDILDERVLKTISRKPVLLKVILEDSEGNKLERYIQQAMEKNRLRWGLAKAEQVEKNLREYYGKQRIIEAEQYANEAIHTWTVTASDTHRYALAMQIAAAKEFGLDIAPLRGATKLEYGAKLAWQEAEDIADSSEGTLNRRFLRHMYEYTQQQLAKAGIKEISMYRGVVLDDNSVPTFVRKKGSGDVQLSPLSSFTAAAATAEVFALHSEGGVIYSGTIPASRIIGSARTGFGCLPEQEFVVLGGKSVLHGEVS